MKRKSNLYSKLLNMSLLMASHELAKKGKRHYTEVKMVDSNPEHYIGKILDTLKKREFKTSPYVVMKKHDGRKDRVIHKLPYYPDRIVQHAIILVCGHIWEKSFIRDTFQSIPGRGTSDARKRILMAMKSKPKYCLKLDIKKFYPSINNEKLKVIVRRKIKDKDMLSLLDNIIDSTKGVPIGNYTSQYFGNLYLYQFDWWVKQKLNIRHYYRYCDDIVIFHNDKTKLKEWFYSIEDYLQKLDLQIKDTWKIYHIKKEGVDFCGYRFFHDYTLLRKSISTKFKRKVSFIKKYWHYLSDSKIINPIMSYWGWVKPINAKNLWRKHVDNTIVDIFSKLNPNIKLRQ